MFVEMGGTLGESLGDDVVELVGEPRRFMECLTARAVEKPSMRSPPPGAPGTGPRLDDEDGLLASLPAVEGLELDDMCSPRS